MTAAPEHEPRDLSFATHDGIVLRGRLFLPAGAGPAPGIVMSHGFSATRRMGLDGHAARHAAAGIAVFAYDHRNLGGSDGVPRGLIDPYVQARDAIAAIDRLAALPEIAPGRIGLWGTSYSGAQALVLAALDPRVRAAVALVPAVGRPDLPGPETDAAWERLAARVRTARQDPDRVVGPRAASAMLADPDTGAWFAAEAARPGTDWRDAVLTPAREPDEPAFDPAPALPHLRAPVLLIAGSADRVAPAADAREAARRAGDRAAFLMLEGHHCTFYDGAGLEAAAAASIAFLGRRL